MLLSVLVLLAWRAWPDGRLHVVFFDTPGDAVLIQSPDGGYVLIDGGADPAALAAALGRRLPFWRRSLDAVVLTVPDGRRLPGQIAALARYHTGVALVPPAVRRSADLQEWQRLLAAEQTPVHTARAGDQLDLGGARLRVLATGDGRTSGLVLRLDYGVTSVMFAHAVSPADERRLLEQQVLRPVSLLAFPWERDPATPFVTALYPLAIVFADGQRAEPPAERTFAERAVGGAALYHERLNGAVEWVSDSRRAWIVTERES